MITTKIFAADNQFLWPAALNACCVGEVAEVVWLTEELAVDVESQGEISPLRIDGQRQLPVVGAIKVRALEFVSPDRPPVASRPVLDPV